MMKLLIAGFALAGILSAPAFFRPSPTGAPDEEIANCKRVVQPLAKVSLQ